MTQRCICGKTRRELTWFYNRPFHACEVPVSEAEIDAAVGDKASLARRTTARANIALGKFIGTYRP